MNARSAFLWRTFFCGRVGALLILLVITPALAFAQDAGKTLMIGVSNIESGNTALYRPMGQALKWYFQYRNLGGGVAGYKIDVNILDNQNTPAGGAQTARQFLNDKVFLLYVVGTPAATGVFSVLQESGSSLPTFTAGAAEIVKKLRGEGKLPNLYGEFPNFDQGALFDMRFLVQDQKKKKVAIIYEDSAVGQKAGKIAPDYAKSIGATEVEAIAIAPTSTNLNPAIAKLKAAGIEAIDVVARPSILVAAQKSAAALGYRPVWMSYASNLSVSYLNMAGPVANGTFFPSFLKPLQDLSDPDVKLFKEQIDKADSNAFGEIAQGGWIMGDVIAAAIEKVVKEDKETLTQASFMRALNNMTDRNIGMVEGLGYTEDDHSSIATKLSVYQIQEGKPVRISPPHSLPTYP